MKQTFEQFMEEKFYELPEIGGVPVTKDNFESIEDIWFANLDVQELIDFGQEYGAQCFTEGQVAGIKTGNEVTLSVLGQLK